MGCWSLTLEQDIRYCTYDVHLDLSHQNAFDCWSQRGLGVVSTLSTCLHLSVVAFSVVIRYSMTRGVSFHGCYYSTVPSLDCRRGEGRHSIAYSSLHIHSILRIPRYAQIKWPMPRVTEASKACDSAEIRWDQSARSLAVLARLSVSV
jgi:hypothetical protein